MKQTYTLLVLLCLLLSASFQGYAQCSGNFVVTYPSGTGTATLSVKNNNANPTATFCPTNGNGTANITVTPESVSDFSITRSGETTPIETHSFTAAEISSNTPYTFVVPISSTSTYTLSTVLTACNNAKGNQIPLQLSPSLAVTSSVGSSVICPNTAVRLTATGGSSGATYTLQANGQNAGSNTTGIFDVTPAASTVYTVAANVTSCNGTVTQRISVATNNIVLGSTDADNNVGKFEPVTITATGATGSITWTAYDGITTTPVAGNGNQITVTPGRTTRYTASGTTATGNCPSTVALTISVNGGVLPVELTQFTAAWSSKGAQLNWLTGSEKNSAYFAIERSFDGKSFESVGKQTSAGTTTVQTSYHFTDQALEATTGQLVYYRLRQVDVTGETSLSPVRTVRLGVKAGFNATVFPNPYSKQLSLRSEVLQAGPLVLTMRNVLGQTVFTQQLTVDGGAEEIQLPEAAALETGVYFLTIQQGRQQQVVKVSHR